jgi:hypothetical protein
VPAAGSSIFSVSIFQWSGSTSLFLCSGDLAFGDHMRLRLSVRLWK